jgi:hypothetical protein
MNHTQNLTSSTLLSLRTELTHLRKTTLTIASDKEMIMEYERREQDLKEQNSELAVRVGLVEAALGEAERVGKEERGRRERLEKEGMGMEGLVGTAKQRLDFLISQVSGDVGLGVVTSSDSTPPPPLFLHDMHDFRSKISTKRTLQTYREPWKLS